MIRALDYLLALPLSSIAAFCYASELKAILSLLDQQVLRVRDFGSRDDFSSIMAALEAGEDRRFRSHFGVDTKALVRALVVYLLRKEIQGGSTITQQLVRVATHDYRRAIGRKVKEVCLACGVDRRVSKSDQAEIYVFLAYYGWRMNGVRQAFSGASDTPGR